MNRIVKRSLTAVLILIVLGVLAYPKVQPLFSSSSETVESSESGNMLQVEGVRLEPQLIEDKIFASGTLQANEVVDLRAEVSGKIVTIYFEEGRPVEAGELLLKINDSELQAQKRRAQFQLNLAIQREERQESLLERGGISQEDYDATVNEVNVLRSEIELIDAQIEKTEIRAPFDGVIGLKYVSEGSFISPETRVASLNDIDPVKIDFSIPERYVSRVDVGDRIDFTIQGRQMTFQGDVYAIEPRIDTETRTLRIRALSSNPENQLVPGAFANIELILQTMDDALMLPSISVIPELNRQKVYRYRDGQVEEVQIETGIRTDQSVQVLNGLAPGDTVLTTGLLQARAGMQVQLTRIVNDLELQADP